jgi:hypothetical protein
MEFGGEGCAKVWMGVGKRGAPRKTHISHVT